MNQPRSFSEIHAAVKEKIKDGGILRLGVAMPRHHKHIEAVGRAIDEGFINATLIGKIENLKALVSSAKVDIGKFDLMESSAPLADGIGAVNAGRLDFLLSGEEIARDFGRVLGKDMGSIADKGAVLIHISVHQIPGYHKPVFLATGTAGAEIDINQTLSIIQNAASLTRMLGIAIPKVALLAAVEAISPSVPVTLEQAAIAKMGDRGQIKNVLIDGPLSFDCAISAEVAQHKGIKNSPVAGDTDIFVPPTVETADGIYKALAMYARAESAGLIYGGKFPIATSFAVDSAGSIFNSIVLGACVALK